MTKTRPSVSVVIPAAGAAELLPDALASIRDQDYPGNLEIVVASADDATTRASGDATVVANPSGSTPVGLNLAWQTASGDVIVRCDAQSKLPSGYVSRAVETLSRTGAQNVGGRQVPTGTTPVEVAIASAMASRFGSGDARYRIGGDEGPVETVYLGVYPRDTLVSLGGFDESFIRTQDYELNHRIREAGGIVWFDPELEVQYRPRSSFRGLARQYFQYGQAKRRFARKHPQSLRLRQLAPPLIVVALSLSLLMSVLVPWLLLVPSLYLVGTLGAGLGGRRPMRTAAALIAMHICWGVGFIVGPRERQPK